MIDKFNTIVAFEKIVFALVNKIRYHKICVASALMAIYFMKKILCS